MLFRVCLFVQIVSVPWIMFYIVLFVLRVVCIECYCLCDLFVVLYVMGVLLWCACCMCSDAHCVCLFSRGRVWHDALFFLQGLVRVVCRCVSLSVA